MTEDLILNPDLNAVSELLASGDLAGAAAEMGCVKAVQKPGGNPSFRVDYKAMARKMASIATGVDIPSKPSPPGRKKSKKIAASVKVGVGAEIPASLLPLPEGDYTCRRVSTRTVGNAVRVTLSFEPLSEGLL